jgi:two-component system response regulator AtoC
MEKQTILIINEDSGTASQFSTLLNALGYGDLLELSYKRGMAWLTQGNSPLLILLNITQFGSEGLKFLTCIREVSPIAPILVVGSATQVRLFVEAVQLGASDYLTPPFDQQQARAAIERALEDRKRNEAKAGAAELAYDDGFSNPEMERAYEIAKMVAPTDVPVLITGETGVGKEVLARFIHDRSNGATKPLLKVNCAALPSDLLESELFGYERGAFTGAMTEKPGKFELANGGTILLDEIGEMSLPLQAKLLHVLQDGGFYRLGGKRQLQMEARVLASTNVELEEAVARGDFRADLYFRLNVIRIKIPPLRERKHELVSLSNTFIRKYSEKYGSSVRELPLDVLQTFMEHDWPGNIRQLENVIKRYLILPGVDVDINDIPEQPRPKLVSAPEPEPIPMARQVVPQLPATPPWLPTEFASLKQVGENAAERAEQEVVLWMLEQTSWNRKLAAHRLNICYKALLNKIKKWQIRRPPSTMATGSRRRLTAV